jgi:hypothetical protein
MLPRVHREFTANVKSGPGGYATLKRVLGESDMEVFKKKWEKFILILRKPE